MRQWFRWPLWARVISGLVVGGIFGLIMHRLGQEAFVTDWIRPFGDAFIRLIRMLVVPLIFTTLVAGMVAMGDPKRLGSLGGRTIALYMGTTWFAVLFGLLVAFIVRPGEGIDVGIAAPDSVDTIRQQSTAQAAGIVERLVGIIPDNPIAALVEGDVLAIIFFSIIFGAGILVSGEKGKAIGAAFESAADVMIRVTEFVMQTAPFGVFALMAWVMAEQGLEILDNLLLLALSLYVACFAHIAVTYSAIVRLWLRLPLVRFYRGMADAIAVAFSTSSSSATLPVTITCATDNLGIKRTVASSVLPLGATINMDGTALYQGIIAVFAAQAFGIDLSIGDVLMIMLTATLVSIGTAGIPSVSLFLAFITLEVIGVTGDNAVLLIALIFPFDRLLDMMRTATNVTGDAAVATAVAKWEGELDEEVFRQVARI
ncbi:MAG TPA: dicarboxylate/amino acid:cation symporter [Gammaproteobacteria bacterium]|nr:dicarboxylate/amino acid:cation symporter [Gammaproteobacteria bacterium]